MSTIARQPISPQQPSLIRMELRPQAQGVGPHDVCATTPTAKAS